MQNNYNHYIHHEAERNELKSSIRWLGAVCLINYFILFTAYLISFIVTVLIFLSSVDKNKSLYFTKAFMFSFITIHFIGTIFLTKFRKDLVTAEKTGSEDFPEKVFNFEHRLFARLIKLSVITSLILVLAFIYDIIIIS